MNTKNIWLGSLGLVLVSGVLAGALPVHADECKDVDIEVKNNKSVKIKALKLEYKFRYDNTWRTESFSNKEVLSGATTRVASNQTEPRSPTSRSRRPFHRDHRGSHPLARAADRGAPRGPACVRGARRG